MRARTPSPTSRIRSHSYVAYFYFSPPFIYPVIGTPRDSPNDGFTRRIKDISAYAEDCSPVGNSTSNSSRRSTQQKIVFARGIGGRRDTTRGHRVNHRSCARRTIERQATLPFGRSIISHRNIHDRSLCRKASDGCVSLRAESSRT